MDYIFYIGLIGAIVLVIGAAWPGVKDKHPVTSIKNWLFAIGNICMFSYAFLGYFHQSAPIFFVFQQILIMLSTIFMMLNTNNKISGSLISIAGLGLITWSLILFEGYYTVIFILGLIGIALGYAFKGGTKRRYLALTLGSLFVAFFSYLEQSWIFFWLNVFFSLFSFFYLLKIYFSLQTKEKIV